MIGLTSIGDTYYLLTYSTELYRGNYRVDNPYCSLKNPYQNRKIHDYFEQLRYTILLLYDIKRGATH